MPNLLNQENVKIIVNVPKIKCGFVVKMETPMKINVFWNVLKLLYHTKVNVDIKNQLKSDF